MHDGDAEDEQHWELGYVIPAHGDDSAEVQPVVRGVGAVSIREVRADNAAVHNYRATVQLAQCVWLNVQEFLGATVAFAKNFQESRVVSEEEHDAICLGFSRQLLNVLSMFRSFLDHSNTSLTRRFGDGSAQLATWKAAVAEQYDASFSYRLLCKLRNYSQHVGTVPLGYSYSADLGPVTSFRLDLSRDELLREPSVWGARVLPELHVAPARMPLLDHLNQWGNCFWNIVRVRERLEREVALPAAHRITSRRPQFSVPENAVRLCALLVQPNADDGSVHFRMEGINERWALRIVSNAGSPNGPA